MKNIILFLILTLSFKGLTYIEIQTVELLATNGNSYLKIKARGADLELDRIEISYFNNGTSAHKIKLIFEGCATSNLLGIYDTTFQINSFSPFDVEVYSIWDTNHLCGFPQDPYFTDSVFMSYLELLATTSLTSLSREFGQIYPNPCQGMITVDFEVESVLIYDVNYSLVNKFGLNSKSLDISNLQSGFYFLEFIQNNKKRVYRILKE
jgi:hypothetical protein